MTIRDPARPLRIAFIGEGAMTRAVLARLDAAGSGVSIMGALDRQDAPASRHGLTRVTDLEALLALGPDLVLECASQGAVAAYAPTLLAAGIDVSVISTGALGDPALLDRIRLAALGSGAQCYVPAGALAGIEALSPARLAGIDRVEYRSIKPPRAWTDTPAEDALDLTALTEATVHFTGDAATAARLYPKNANVAVTAALYGIGLEQTTVTLIADPGASGNRHEVEARGPFGHFQLAIGGPALPDNPKTSQMAALSVADLILRRTAPLVL